MSLILSSRSGRMTASPTIAMNQRAGELKAQGLDIIDLTVGEPDFPTPRPIIDAAKRALDEGYTRYTAVPGLAELREAICAKLRRDCGLDYGKEDVVVSCGAKQALANAILALVDVGDEAIIPNPSWSSYAEMAKLAGGQPVFVPTERKDGYRLDPDRLEAAITARSKVLVLCSPSNPTGAVMSRADFEGLLPVLERHPGLFILSDEVYGRIDYSGKVLSPAAFSALAGRTAVIGGVSKSYAMTGFRLGWIAGPRELAMACAKIQGQTTTSAATVAQRAALAALGSDPRIVEDMVAAYARRRSLVLSRLSRLEALRVFPPEGAFYVFPEVSGLDAWKSAEEGRGSEAVARLFLDKALVATVPGSAFGDDRCLRISFAKDEASLEAAFDRIESVLGGH